MPKEDAEEICPICMQKMEYEEDLKDMQKKEATLESCKHMFHYDCIQLWTNMQRNQCPLCDLTFNKIKTVNDKFEEIVMEV